MVNVSARKQLNELCQLEFAIGSDATSGIHDLGEVTQALRKLV